MLMQQFKDLVKIESNNNENTAKAYINAVECMLEYFKMSPATFQKEANSSMIREYINYLRFEKRYAYSTTNQRIFGIKKFLKVIDREDLYDKFPKIKRNADEKEKLHEDKGFINYRDIPRVMNYLFENKKITDVMLFVLTLGAGMRIGEVENLDLTSLDVGDLSVYIHDAKGGKSRVSYIHEEYREYVELYMEYRLQKETDLKALFVSNKGNPLSKRQMQDRIKKCLVEVGYPELSAHKLRHSCASMYIKKGAPISSVSRMLGHANSDITLRVYTHSDDGDVREMMQGK